MLPGKVEQMTFLRQNQFFIPEIGALNKAKQEKKGAAAKCADKVAVVQRAAEGSQVAVALYVVVWGGLFFFVFCFSLQVCCHAGFFCDLLCVT